MHSRNLAGLKRSARRVAIFADNRIRVRGRTWFLKVLVAALCFQVVSPMSAAAVDCLARTYAAARDFTSPANLGIRGFFFVHASTAYDYAAGGHINATLWEGTAGSTDLHSWVEVGATKGWHGTNQLTFYWADDRPDLPYAEHIINTPQAAANTWYWFKIQYTGNSTWTVYINGDQPNNGGGVSTSNPANSRSMQAGLESTSECSNLGSQGSPGISDNLSYYTSGGGWTGSWGSTTTKYVPGAAAGEWVTQFEDWHFWL